MAQVIRDIDAKGMQGDASEALAQAVAKVAFVARDLYLPCEDRSSEFQLKLYRLI